MADDEFHSRDCSWGPLPRDEAVAALADKAEGTFLIRMSQTDSETYSISVVQNGNVRHIRIIYVPDSAPGSGTGGYCINKADTPCQTLTELLKEKMGEKIKSKLAGGDTQETQLLMIPLSPPEESDDEELMANLMSSSSK